MIELNKSLKNYNSFGFEHFAERFVAVSTEDELEQIVESAQHNKWPVFILGGGSNLVITRDIPGLVIHLTNSKIELLSSDGNGDKIVRAGAGANWHSLVLETLEMKAQGLENLSLIPGSVGAAPVQNIGAYGVEVKDRIRNVRAFHIPTLSWHELSVADCKFAYRHSMFKDSPNEYIISEVDFNLGNQCEVHAEYGSLKEYLLKEGIENPTPLDISQSVSKIRRARLPDPLILGNAGSFFHNPIVSSDFARNLESRFNSISTYRYLEGYKKISAAWLIQEAGFKGYRRNNVGVYEKHSLVLVHYGESTSTALIQLALEIESEVFDLFDVKLKIEPTVI